ncbi:uncharacterized [Tachysurus ichikawai]
MDGQELEMTLEEQRDESVANTGSKMKQNLKRSTREQLFSILLETMVYVQSCTSYRDATVTLTFPLLNNLHLLGGFQKCLVSS